MKSWRSFSQETLPRKSNKDYDGDGKVESGSKEHAGVVHNAIQRAKGKKAMVKIPVKKNLKLKKVSIAVLSLTSNAMELAVAPERTWKWQWIVQRKSVMRNVNDRRIERYKGKHGQSEVTKNGGDERCVVERAKKERDERRKSRMKKEEVELQELDIKGAVTGENL